MDKNFISIDLDDPKTGLVAEALSNKTCVKILSLLAEEELTASDVSSRLKIPLNTTGYNIDKLVSSGLVEKSSNFFWSVKGKKTPVYKVANKKIVISPKKSVKGIVPAVLISGLFALGLKISKPFTGVEQLAGSGVAKAVPESAAVLGTPEGISSYYADEAIRAVPEAVSVTSAVSSSNIWAWFFIGALFSLIVFFLWDFIFSKRRSKFK